MRHTYLIERSQMVTHPNDPTSTASQIRFDLGQLSSKNGHHAFEHLCRHVARARITKLILPATGPVSAGGDQGADFETIPGVDDSSTGLCAWREQNDGAIAFACTLTKAPNLLNKVKSDVRTIMAGANVIKAVHYFASADIPKAKRKNLITWAKENHNVQLVVYDGQAISEWLADPDVIWIAERFLNTPRGLLETTKHSTDALCVAESNVVDVCFFDTPLDFEVQLSNRAEADWFEVSLSAWATPFASEDPLANPMFQQLTYRRFDVIAHGTDVRVNLSGELRRLLERSPSLSQIILRPFQALHTYQTAISLGAQISLNCNLAQMPIDLLQLLKTLLDTDNARILLSSRGCMRAGMLVVLVLEGRIQEDGRTKRFVKVLPFLNTWIGMHAPARTASDAFFINSPVPVMNESVDGVMVKSCTWASYSLQYSTQLSDAIAAEGAMLRTPSVTANGIGGSSVTAQTFVIIGNPELRFFDACIQPNNGPGEETQLESPF